MNHAQVDLYSRSSGMYDMFVTVVMLVMFFPGSTATILPNIKRVKEDSPWQTRYVSNTCDYLFK